MGAATALTLQTSLEVMKAWELFVTGSERYLDKVRPEIRESWRRSKQVGVNPTIQQVPAVLGPEELNRKFLQTAHLLEAGREVIPILSQALTAESFLVGIGDCEGNLLYTYSPSHSSAIWEDSKAVPGARIQESLVGTTPSGMALYLNRPVQVYWYEYYAKFGHSLTGCAAPIRNPWGDTKGTLAIAGYQEVAHPRALDLVVFAAGLVEERIKRFEELACFEVLKEFNRYLVKFPKDPLFALDQHGRILALSPAMTELLTSQLPERLIGQHLCDIRDFQFEHPLPFPGDVLEPDKSSLVFPLKREVCRSTIIPVSSRKGGRAGMVVIVSGLDRPGYKKATRLPWQATHTFHDLIGRSSAFCRALQLAEKAAEHDYPVLLVGESGTGKELFAQAIHRASRRAHGPFVAINCSTIPRELLAAELFGYEEGAFSGALRRGKRGKIELAHQGTLFLDEAGDMPAEVQLGLLRVLEEGKVVPLGSEYPRAVDVQVTTAMNSNPLAAVAQGKLRLDLYHRLNVFPIPLPSLRERFEDLPLLIRHLLEREGFSDTEVSPEVMETFRRYVWPGNIRELRNVLVRAAMLSANRIITREDLPPELLTYKPLPPLQEASSRRLDREQIQQALRECGGHISRTAHHLGIHRVTLHRKLRAYGLTRESLARESGGRM